MSPPGLPPSSPPIPAPARPGRPPFSPPESPPWVSSFGADQSRSSRYGPVIGMVNDRWISIPLSGRHHRAQRQGRGSPQADWTRRADRADHTGGWGFASYAAGGQPGPPDRSEE